MFEITIIICTFNRSKLLQKTLESCSKLTGYLQIEILVVDNNSDDDTKLVITKWIVNQCNKKIVARYIKETRQGLSHARNTGIKEANGNIIAFLDDDAIPNPDWIQVICQSFKTYSDALALGGKVLPDYEISKPEWLSSHKMDIFLSIMDLGELPIEYPQKKLPIGVNIAFRRDTLKEDSFSVNLGRSGASLLSGEETALLEGIKKEGKIYYIPNMCVTHFIPKERLTKQWLFSRAYAQGVSVMRYHCKSIFSYYFMKILWFYTRRKSRMLVDIRYRNKMEKQCGLAYEKGIVDEIMHQSKWLKVPDPLE